MIEKNVGDFLITFNCEKGTWPTRSGQAWELMATIGQAYVWFTQPGSKWKGSPLSYHNDENRQVWAIGEFFQNGLTNILTTDLPAVYEKMESLNGHFVIITFEKRERRWHVINNRLATLHAYHAAKGEKVSLGTFSPAVAASAKCSQLDWDAIACFFKFGFFLSAETYWKDVHFYQPATHDILDEEGRILARRKYWHLHYEPEYHMEYSKAVDLFYEVFREVLREQVEHKQVAVPLSGGLDSRCTLAELGFPDRGGADGLYLYSYGYSDDSVETRIARQLADKRNLDIRSLTIKPYLFDQIDHICACVEGFQEITQCRSAYVEDELSQNADHVVAAHWGDVWLDDMGFQEHPFNQQPNLALSIYKKFSKKNIDGLFSLFSAPIPANWELTLQEKVESSVLETIGIDDIDFQVKAWKTEQWSARWTLASMRMFQAGAFPLLPFYDNRLVDYFCRLPGNFVQDRQLQIDYLKKYAPDLANVKWQVYDANLYHYKLFNTLLLPQRVFRKAKRVLSNKPVIQRNWEVQFLNPRGKEGVTRWLLEDGLKLHEFVQCVELSKLIDEFYQKKDPINAYYLSMLLTFSVWLEKFG